MPNLYYVKVQDSWELSTKVADEGYCPLHGAWSVLAGGRTCPHCREQVGTAEHNKQVKDAIRKTKPDSRRNAMVLQLLNEMKKRSNEALHIARAEAYQRTRRQIIDGVMEKLSS